MEKSFWGNDLKYLHALCTPFALAAAVAPCVAMAEAPPLSAYGSLADVEMATLSPSGNRYAMVLTIEGKRQLVVMENGTPLRRAILGDDNKIRSIDWIDDEKLMMVTSATVDLASNFRTDKAELFSAHVVPAQAGSSIRTVFADNSSVLDAVFGDFGVRTVSGHPVAYFGGIDLVKQGSSIGRSNNYVFEHGRPALKAVNLTDMSVRDVASAPPDGSTRDWLVGAGGEVVATLTLKSTNGDWTIENRDGKAIASGTNPLGGVSLLSIGAGGDTVVYSQGDPLGTTRWLEVPMDGSSQAKEFLPDIAVSDLYTDRNTGRFIGYMLDNGDRVMLDARSNSRMRAIKKAFPNVHASVRDWSNGLGQMLVHTSGNQDSGSWFFVDLVGSKANSIAFERMAIEPADVGPISTFTYTASDGMEMDAILTLPPGREAKDLPVIVLPHGGPHSHDEAEFDWWAQAYASRGYAVLQPNFRGSTNRDAAFRRAGYGEWGGKMQTDLSDGLASLAETGMVDASRACIVGASYGGYAALAGVTIQNGLYKCAVAVAPVTDLSLKTKLGLRESGSRTRKMRSRVYEAILGSGENFDAVSPYRLAGRADAPILLIHGRDDTVVEYVHSTKMADALKDAGKPFEFVELKGEDHWLSTGVTRQQMLEASMAFVMRYNPPD